MEITRKNIKQAQIDKIEWEQYLIKMNYKRPEIICTSFKEMFGYEIILFENGEFDLRGERIPKDSITKKSESLKCGHNSLWEILKVGAKVYLDADLNNSSTVEIVSQSPKRLYTRVKSTSGEEWTIMTIRLFHIN